MHLPKNMGVSSDSTTHILHTYTHVQTPHLHAHKYTYDNIVLPVQKQGDHLK